MSFLDKTSPEAANEHGRTRRKKRPHKRQIAVRVKGIHGVTPRKVLGRHERIYFPAVIGEEWADTEDSTWSDFTTVGGGEYSVPMPGKRARMLRSFDTTTMSLTWDANFLSYHGVDPQKLRTHLTAILRAKKPVHLTAVVHGHRHPEFDAPVTLRSLTRRLPHGEQDTRYYDLSFREYRYFNVKTRRHGNAPLPTKRRLQEGDTLRSLAFFYYGDSNLWRDIAHANGIVRWGSEDVLTSMTRFRLGDIISIPEKPEADPTDLFATDDDDSGVFLSEDI